MQAPLFKTANVKNQVQPSQYRHVLKMLQFSCLFLDILSDPSLPSNGRKAALNLSKGKHEVQAIIQNFSEFPS